MVSDRNRTRFEVGRGSCFNKEASLMGERVRVHNSLADRKTSLEGTLSINEMEKLSQLHFLLWLYRLTGVDDRVTVDGMIIF